MFIGAHLQTLSLMLEIPRHVQVILVENIYLLKCSVEILRIPSEIVTNQKITSVITNVYRIVTDIGIQFTEKVPRIY